MLVGEVRLERALDDREPRIRQRDDAHATVGRRPTPGDEPRALQAVDAFRETPGGDHGALRERGGRALVGLPGPSQGGEHIELAGRQAVLLEDAFELDLDPGGQPGESPEHALRRHIELGALAPPFGLDARDAIGSGTVGRQRVIDLVVSSGVAAMLMATSPAVILLLAWPLAKERPAALSLSGAVIGFAGVVLLLAGATGTLDLWGVAASLAAMLMSSVGFVLARRWNDGTPALSITAWQLTFGGLALVPVALLAEGAPPALDAAGLAGAAYLALVVTVLAGIVLGQPAIAAALRSARERRTLRRAERRSVPTDTAQLRIRAAGGV